MQLWSSCYAIVYKRYFIFRVVSEKGDTVMLQSSVESKGIIGNDSRHYVLDLLRTFAPDVNYLLGTPGKLTTVWLFHCGNADCGNIAALCQHDSLLQLVCVCLSVM